MDVATIKDDNNYVYWWYLANFKEPDNGSMSEKVYIQGDCDMPRIKVLSNYFYNKAMGENLALSINPPAPKWTYLPPDTVAGLMLDAGCQLSQMAKEMSPENYQEELEYFQLIAQDSYLQMQLESISEILEQTGELISDDTFNELKDSYINSTASKIRKEWRYLGAEDHWSCYVHILQTETGDVLDVIIKNCTIDDSSKAKSFKDSIERAVYKASPLPIAPDQDLFDAEVMFHFSVD